MSYTKWNSEKQHYLEDNMHKTVKQLAIDLQVCQCTVRSHFHKTKKKIKSNRTTPPAQYSNVGYLSLINA